MSWWEKAEVTCRVCPSGGKESVMEELVCDESSVDGDPAYYIFWCPLCGSLARLLENEPISFSDFTAPYVSFEKDSAVRAPRVCFKKEGT